MAAFKLGLALLFAVIVVVSFFGVLVGGVATVIALVNEAFPIGFNHSFVETVLKTLLFLLVFSVSVPVFNYMVKETHK